MLMAAVSYTTRTRWIHSRSVTHSTLADLMPKDLADMPKEVLGALGVQLLLFGGFVKDVDGGKWIREQRRGTLLTLTDRVDRIAPTWKPRGGVDYSWPWLGASTPSRAGRTFSLFLEGALLRRSLDFALVAATHAHTEPRGAGAGTTVRALAEALESDLGLAASDFDTEARAALSEMLAWRFSPTTEQLQVPTHGSLTLLVLSFDATPDCRSVADCPRPGPSNELLAATAADFVRRRRRDHDQHVEVIAQWEVAAAMATLGAPAQAVGRPGRFENTAEIFEHMGRVMGRTCGVSAKVGGRSAAASRAEEGAPLSSRLVLLAHPDHLRRSLRIGETVLPRVVATAASSGSCSPLPIVPAMQAYRLDWPDQGPSTDVHLNLFAAMASPTTQVHVGGALRNASWYDANAGFFPEGDPQKWVHHREVWLCYEFWARAIKLS